MLDHLRDALGQLGVYVDAPNSRASAPKSPCPELASMWRIGLHAALYRPGVFVRFAPLCNAGLRAHFELSTNSRRLRASVFCEISSVRVLLRAEDESLHAARPHAGGRPGVGIGGSGGDQDQPTRAAATMGLVSIMRRHSFAAASAGSIARLSDAVRQPPRPGQAPLGEGTQVGGKPTPECRLALLGARASRRDPLEANYVTAERTHDAVHGPPLTPEEAVASIARRVREARRRASTASRRSCAPASIPESTQKRCAGASRPYSAPRRFASRPH